MRISISSDRWPRCHGDYIFLGGFCAFSSEIAAQNLINSNVSVLLGSPLMNEIGNYEKHQV